MKKLLITGATGFLGRNALDVLPAMLRDVEVHAITRSGNITEHADVSWHTADFTDESSMAQVFGSVQPTHLLNLAWIGAELREDRYHSPLNHEWADATAAVFDLFQQHGGKRLVNAGSCLEYGGSPSPWDESALTTPDTAYGQGKLAASEKALALENVSVAVGRIFFTYGPHEDRRRLVSDVITSLLAGEQVALSAGSQRRDYLHMADVARALIMLCSHDGEGVYNIGAAQSWPVAELAKQIGKQLGREDLLLFGARPGGADTAADMTAVVTRLETELGWHPTFTLESGLEDCIAWWRGQTAESD